MDRNVYEDDVLDDRCALIYMGDFEHGLKVLAVHPLFPPTLVAHLHVLLTLMSYGHSSASMFWLQ